MFPASSGKMGGPPKARVCYICGRQYMLHSFDIHVTQCRDLFEKRENTKPPKERRKCPTDPMQNSHLGGSGSNSISRKELDAINSASQQTWTGSLAQCKYCGRSFLPEKIGIHNKSCTADNPARRVDESVNRRTQNYDGNNIDQQNTGKLSSSSRKYEPEQASSMSGGGAEYMDTVQCKDCGRSFISTSFAKHAKICRKVFASKRKPFDSAKARAKGTELASFQQKLSKQSYSSNSKNGARSSSTGAPPQRQVQPGTELAGGLPKWKAESLAFREAMRQAKMVSKAEAQSKATGIPLHKLLPPSSNSGGGGGGNRFGGGEPTIDPSYIQCPTCGRSFNQKAGERHIPQCSNIMNKPSRLIRNSGQPSYSTNSPSPAPLPVNSRSRGATRNNNSGSGSSGYGSMRDRQHDLQDDHGYEIPPVKATVVRHSHSGADSLSSKLDGLTLHNNPGHRSNGNANERSNSSAVSGYDSVGASSRMSSAGSRAVSGSRPSPGTGALSGATADNLYGATPYRSGFNDVSGSNRGGGRTMSSAVGGFGDTISSKVSHPQFENNSRGAPRYPSAGRSRR